MLNHIFFKSVFVVSKSFKKWSLDPARVFLSQENCDFPKIPQWPEFAILMDESTQNKLPNSVFKMGCTFVLFKNDQH